MCIRDSCGSTSGVREHEAALIVLRSCITDGRVITAEQAVREILDADENGIRAGSEV